MGGPSAAVHPKKTKTGGITDTKSGKTNSRTRRCKHRENVDFDCCDKNDTLTATQVPTQVDRDRVRTFSKTNRINLHVD